jgi:hypothetical protein
VELIALRALAARCRLCLSLLIGRLFRGDAPLFAGVYGTASAFGPLEGCTVELFVSTQAPTAFATPVSPVADCLESCGVAQEEDDQMPTCMLGCDAALVTDTLAATERATSLGEICQSFAPLFETGCLSPCADSPDEAAEALYIFRQCCACYTLPPRPAGF